MAKMSPCLGLVGGLGVGATVYYYEKLAQAHAEQNRSLDLVISHAETACVFGYVKSNDRAGLAEYLNTFIRRLKTAGAEVAAVPAVTAHFCVRELLATSPLPIFNIFEPLREELATTGAKRVAIFGTRFVIESALFGELHGVEVAQPQPHEITDIHETYVELARVGKGSKDQHEKLEAIAHAIISREKVDAIIFAGTDLALLFDETNTDFPHVDCAALHLGAIMKGLLKSYR